MADNTAQEEVWDAVLRLHIYELQHASHISAEVTKLLDSAYADIEAKILQKLNAFKPPMSSQDYDRLKALKAAIESLRADSWDKALQLMIESANNLALKEPDFLSSLIENALPVEVTTLLPTANMLKSIVTSRPFQGKLLKEWAAQMKKNDIDRIGHAIQVGMVQGETTPQIVRRVLGTKAANYADGIVQMTRNDVDAVVKTAISHVAAEARKEFYSQNLSIIPEEQFVATLDSRTTPFCRADDGKFYKVGTGPQPPLHFRCRSLRIPRFDLAFLSERPAKPITEKQLLREFADKQGFEKLNKRSSLPHGMKGKYDAFKRKRLRELVGPVPATETYQSWLTKQSTAFQDDVLGKARAQLFREGGLTLDKFVDVSGGQLTLADLAVKYKNAFKKAGLNTETFRPVNV